MTRTREEILYDGLSEFIAAMQRYVAMEPYTGPADHPGFWPALTAATEAFTEAGRTDQEDRLNEITVTVQNTWTINGIGQPLDNYEVAVLMSLQDMEPDEDWDIRPAARIAVARISLAPGESQTVGFKVNYPTRDQAEMKAGVAVTPAEHGERPRPTFVAPVTIRHGVPTYVLAPVGESRHDSDSAEEDY